MGTKWVSEQGDMGMYLRFQLRELWGEVEGGSGSIGGASTLVPALTTILV